MDPTRDNPILRFTSFWWAVGTFLLFAFFLAGIWVLTRTVPESMEDAAAKPRYVTKDKVSAEQDKFLSDDAVKDAVAVVGKQLANSKPLAVETPAQIVPGSATSKKLAGGPASDMDKVNSMVASDAVADAAQIEAGKASYMLCGACHGQNGEGGAIAPPLAGSEWVTGPVSNLILIQLRGLQGAITVAGKEYNMPGGMAALAFQSDQDIANVLTYIRNSFGNKASPVKPEQVAALRGEVGKPQVTAGELIKP